MSSVWWTISSLIFHSCLMFHHLDCFSCHLIMYRVYPWLVARLAMSGSDLLVLQTGELLRCISCLVLMTMNSFLQELLLHATHLSKIPSLSWKSHRIPHGAHTCDREHYTLRNLHLDLIITSLWCKEVPATQHGM